MDFEEDSFHEEKVKYFVIYKVKSNGSMGIVTTYATSKLEVEERFNEKLPDYEIFKTRDLYEFTEDYGKETANNLINHIKTLESLIDRN